MVVNLYDLLAIYEDEIAKNVKNKKLIYMFEKNKMSYLIEIKRILESGTYDGGKYNLFIIKEPKVRLIMSQKIFDKVINHYVAKFILEPKLEKYLCKENSATRKNMGSSYALRKLKKDIEYFKKYENFYFLKFDLRKYFYSIDHKVLKSLLLPILSNEEYELLNVIIDSTNHNYIIEEVKSLELKNGIELPKIEYGKSLPIGNMTSQILAIFYLYKVHHFIRHNLKIKFFNLYMDDYLLLHQDKEYLKKCLNILRIKLAKEYLISFNESKTQISSAASGISFLGYTFKVINNKTVVKITSQSKKNIKRKVKSKLYLFKNNKLSFDSLFSSIQTYKYSYIFTNLHYMKKLVENNINKL